MEQDTMAHTASEKANLETAKEYFRRLDAGRTDLGDLFTDDVEVYFPKFGVAKGKASLELASGLFSRIRQSAHDIDLLLCISNGNHVVTEGTSRGTAHSGSSWIGGGTPAGRFCNVFHFRDGKIDRVHVHLDPDYGSEGRERFLWGIERAW
jgi:ketosteroid isomerase-like protein